MWNETIRLAEEGKTYEAPPPAPRPEAQSYQTQLSPEAVRTLLRVIEVRLGFSWNAIMSARKNSKYCNHHAELQCSSPSISGKCTCFS